MNQGAFVWNSGPAPAAGPYVVTLVDDGYLVITTSSATGSLTLVWTTEPLLLAKKSPSLAMGGYLATNDYLSSADGSYFAVMQAAGNLVIYHGCAPLNQGAYVWDSGVVPGGDPHFFATLHTDGNLVVYRGSDPMHQGALVWNTGPAPVAGPYVATLQNDGNLVVTTATASPILVWSAQPLPSITLTITNQIEDDNTGVGSNDTTLTVSITFPQTGMNTPSLTLTAGHSGSLPLPLNTTTEVHFEQWLCCSSGKASAHIGGLNSPMSWVIYQFLHEALLQVSILPLYVVNQAKRVLTHSR